MIFQNGLKSWEGWTHQRDDKATSCFTADFSWSALCQKYFKICRNTFCTLDKYIFQFDERDKLTRGMAKHPTVPSWLFICRFFCHRNIFTKILLRPNVCIIEFCSHQHICTLLPFAPDLWGQTRVMSSSWRFYWGGTCQPWTSPVFLTFLKNKQKL